MSLLAWYRLDGNALDSSGNNFHAAANNGSYSTGKIGSAYLFSNVNNSVVSNSDLTINGNISFSVWCRPSDLTTPTEDSVTIRGVISNLNHSSFANFSMFVLSSRLRVHVGFTDNTRSDVLTGSTVIQINNWYHFAMTYNDTTKVLRTYINGVLESQTTLAKQPKFLPQRIILGQWSYSYLNNYEFFGLIDEGRVYNHTLTDMEIQELARAKILHYSFDDFQEPTTNLVSSPFNFTSGYATSLSASNGTILNFNNQANAGTLTSTTSGYYARLETLTLNKKYTTTWILKQGTLTSVNLNWGGSHGGTRVNFTFNLITGEISSLSLPAGENYGVVKEVNGFWRIWYSSTLTSSTNYFPQLTLSGAGNIILGAIQIEEKPHGTEFTLGTRTGKVNDYSGFFNHSVSLTETNTPRWISNSKVGAGAYDFRLSDSKTYIIGPSNLMQLFKDFTTSAWIYLKSAPTNTNLGYVITQQYGGGGWIFSVRGTDSKLQFRHHRDTANGFITAYNLLSTISLQLNTWYYVAAKDNGLTAKIYINGVENNSFTISSIIPGPSNQPFRIGAFDLSGNAHFDGTIDDVRLYSTALSDKDILDLYNTKAEIEQSGVLYARDFLSNAEATVNLISTNFSTYNFDSSGFATIGTRTVQSDGSVLIVNNNSNSRLARFNIPILVNVDYTISVKIRKVSGTGPLPFRWQLQGRNSSLSVITTFWTELVAVHEDNLGWQTLSYTFKFTNSTITNLYAWFQSGADFTGYTHSYYLAEPQLEQKSYATPFISTFRPAIELPTGVQFGADEIHETGIANFEDFSTVGITDGLIGYWPLDKNAKDYSGSNYNLTDPNANVLIQDGARFTGTSAQKLFVENFPKYTSNFTWSVDLINTVQNTNQQFVVSLGRDCCNVYGMNIRVLNGIIDVFIGTNTIINTGISCVNQLRNVIVSVDSTNVRVYVDGVQTNIIAIPVFAYGIATALVVGKMSSFYADNTVYFPFNGTIKNFKIFNRALTAEEIQIEYNTMFNNEVQIHKNGTLYAKNIIQY
jgi:hypothetical protein